MKTDTDRQRMREMERKKERRSDRQRERERERQKDRKREMWKPIDRQTENEGKWRERKRTVVKTEGCFPYTPHLHTWNREGITPGCSS